MAVLAATQAAELAVTQMADLLAAEATVAQLMVAPEE
jgi:hypothetical protein